MTLYSKLQREILDYILSITINIFIDEKTHQIFRLVMPSYPLLISLIK